MEQSWQVRRSTVPQPDAQQRWDLAYQFLLQWLSHAVAIEASASRRHLEEHHGDCRLCSGLDAASTADADD